MNSFTTILCTYKIKKILEYGQIAQNRTESMIPDTEGCSYIYKKCPFYYVAEEDKPISQKTC